MITAQHDNIFMHYISQGVVAKIYFSNGGSVQYTIGAVANSV